MEYIKGFQTNNFSVEFPKYPLMKAYYESNKLVIDYPEIEIINHIKSEFEVLFKTADDECYENHRIN